MLLPPLLARRIELIIEFSTAPAKRSPRHYTIKSFGIKLLSLDWLVSV